MGEYMTKSELIEELAQRAGLNKVTATLVVNTVFDAVTDALQSGEKVEIRNFGNFRVKLYDAYTGRNPRTGDSVEVPPKRMPYFKASKAILELLNP
jgi:integration host factor subunit beta